MMEEYIFYVLPALKEHETQKKCYHQDVEPDHLDDFICKTNMEADFRNKELCDRCAFYTRFWYDHMILEKRTYTFHQKSKFRFNPSDISSIFPNIKIHDYDSIYYVDIAKVENAYQQLSQKRAYILRDIETYDHMIELFQYILNMNEKYHIHIFFEELR